MTKIISKMKKKKGLFDFILLASGSMLGQGMAILFAPILSRIYTEEQMGTYTLILTAVGMFESAICLRYDLILVSEKNENKIKSIAFSCFRITLLLSLIVTLVYTVYLLITDQLPISKMWLGLFVFPALMCGGIILILTALNNRNREYKNIASSSLAQGFVHNGLSTVLGLTHIFGAIGLIIGRLAGYIAYILLASRTEAVRSIKNNELLNKTERLIILKENKKQALFSTPAVIISCFSYSIINLFLSQLYGKSTLGIYSYSYRLLGLPLTVISANISRMFFKDASVEYQGRKNMRHSFFKMLVPILCISIVMVFCFEMFAPSLFAFFLGDRWREAGVFVQILAPMYGIRLLSNSFSNATIVTGKQFVSLIVQILYLIAAALVFFICKINSLGVYSFLKIMNILFCVIYAIYFFVLATMCLRTEKGD